MRWLLLVTLLSTPAWADVLECNPKSEGTVSGKLGTFAGREVTYRQCREAGGPEVSGQVWLDWTDPDDGKARSQALVGGPCVTELPRRQDLDLVVELPECTRYSEGGSTTVRYRFSAVKDQFVETGRVAHSPLADTIVKVREALAGGDLAGATGLLWLLGTDVSGGWNDHSREWFSLVATGAHQEALIRYQRGDKLGAAAVAAWVFTLPYGLTPQQCAELEKGFCVNVDLGGLPFDRSPQGAKQVNDLGFFLGEALPLYPHRQMGETALRLGTAALRAVTTAFPEREVAWLNLADLWWAAGARVQAREAYSKWWGIAKGRGGMMLPRVKERL